MPDTFARRYAGAGPWEEVWFLEVVVGDGAARRGLWLRWVITDGADAGSGPRERPRASAAVWATVFQGADVRAHHDLSPLVDLDASDGFGLRGAPVVLTREGAVGRCGPFSWDLKLVDLGRRHVLVPGKLERLGIGRHYVPAIADLAVHGTVDVGGETWSLDGARGVLGHIWGGRNRTRGWAWAHCGAFEGADALFEGLSARLGQGNVVTPPLTCLALHLDGRVWRFDRVRDLVTVRSRFGGGRWTFEARRRGVRLVGEAALPERPARVRYVDPDGQPSWCLNHRLSTLRLSLRDDALGIQRDLASREAAFEVGTRDPIPDAVDAG